MRTVYIELAGKEYPMSFSLGASKKLTSKYGSMEGLKKAIGTNGDDTKKLDMITELLELLIAQGCARKNAFEKDIPAPENAPVVDGKWVPITKEEIDLVVELPDMDKIKEKLEECMSGGTKKTVTTKSIEKNAETAPED